ncbi:unnamed protein product, partial [marine sediment metagenome]
HTVKSLSSLENTFLIPVITSQNVDCLLST